MRLFKKRNRKEAKTEIGKDKLAKTIVDFILKTQTGFATSMGRRTEKLSSSTMKYMLALFLLCGSSLSIYLIVTAFKKNGQSTSVKIDRLSVPRYYDKNGNESIQPGFFITDEEHLEMQAFKIYMDSLRGTQKGRLVYDSILLIRPGLIDSVTQLEEIYRQQSQNKK